MPTHTSKSLFDQNIKSCDHLFKLYDGLEQIAPKDENKWLLRAAIVFASSALDAYFHDKVKYRAGHFKLEDMPESLRQFKVEIGGLGEWDKAKRKGNVVRNWVVSHYSTRPLQKTEDIKNALKLVGIEDVWGKTEPNSPKRDAMLKELRAITKRRNEISHEGDRLAHRSGGKKLRAIDKAFAENAVKFITDLVAKIENQFPN